MAAEPDLKAMILGRVYLPFDEMRRAAYVTHTSIIIAKFKAYEDSQSTRHLDDIASIIKLQGQKLDGAQSDIAAICLGLLGIWRALWAQNQPD